MNEESFICLEMQKIQQTTLECAKDAQDSTSMQIPAGPTVSWHQDLVSVPRAPTLFIAQEFFDALPVHQFEYTSR